MTTTTNAMGSGCEVESATFVPAVPAGELTPAGRSGFRGKLDGLKSRGLGKVHDVKSSMGGQVDRVQTSMKTSPMLWAGVAAGSGFALGMLGRFIHWRNNHRRAVPELVIIDATC